MELLHRTTLKVCAHQPAHSSCPLTLTHHMHLTDCLLTLPSEQQAKHSLSLTSTFPQSSRPEQTSNQRRPLQALPPPRPRSSAGPGEHHSSLPQTVRQCCRDKVIVDRVEGDCGSSEGERVGEVGGVCGCVSGSESDR